MKEASRRIFIFGFLLSYMEFDLQKELMNLKRMMEEGKLDLLPDMAEDLRAIKERVDGTVVEETVSPNVKTLLQAMTAAREDKSEI